MRSEFEKTLKQHRDALTEELVKLGKHRQVQLAEWDIEQNESDYEFYFNAGWNAQQSKVDELQCEVKRINLWYSNVKLQLENKGIDSAIDAKKIDELQRRNQMLNDNIKEQGQKLVYQNEVIETQAEKLLGLRDEKAELQKRLDAALIVAQSIRKEIEHGHLSDDESKTLSSYADDLEQALKGGSDASN